MPANLPRFCFHIVNQEGPAWNGAYKPSDFAEFSVKAPGLSKYTSVQSARSYAPVCNMMIRSDTPARLALVQCPDRRLCPE